MGLTPHLLPCARGLAHGLLPWAPRTFGPALFAMLNQDNNMTKPTAHMLFLHALTQTHIHTLTQTHNTYIFMCQRIIIFYAMFSLY